MTTDQILLGVGLTLSLAVGCQVLASRLRIPALIVLLPVGFAAGAMTKVVNPNQLLGPLFGPMVSLAVAVILFDSGLGLDLAKLLGHSRRVVRRLIVIGVPVTWAVAAVSAAVLLGMSERSAVMLGAILVVSGPTVVGPLLNFVRPTERVQRTLIWEGSLIDPVGAIVGALTFHAVVASTPGRLGPGIGHFLGNVAVGLVAVLVLVVRPLVALASTLWTDLSKGERGFIGWMAPRGIVAASTASTFSATLVANRIGGAERILPVTFLVIVMTVVLYGLTAEPAARLLGVMRPARTRPLLVGGLPWVVDLGRALRSAGLDVLMWAGLQAQRDQITRAGLELARGELLAAATSRGAELEGVTAVLLLTGEDDFNALASTTLQANLDGPVYRVAAPHDSHGVVAPYTGAEVLFGDPLTGRAIDQRHQDGAGIVTRPANGAVPDGYDLLFLVRADGRLFAVTKDRRPAPEDGDTLVLLGPAAPAADASSAPGD